MQQPMVDKGAGKSPDKNWSVYLLRCADGTLYCGATNDIARRLAAHGRGQVKYTRGRLPVELAHLERADDKGAALSREAACKRLSRAAKLALIACAATPNSLHAPDDDSTNRPKLGGHAPRLRRQRKQQR
jgi:putative endonuclease